MGRAPASEGAWVQRVQEKVPASLAGKEAPKSKLKCLDHGVILKFFFDFPVLSVFSQ